MKEQTGQTRRVGFRPGHRQTAVLALLGATLLWGSSFTSIKVCGSALAGAVHRHVPSEFGPLLLTAVRFTLALPLLLLGWRPARNLRMRASDLPYLAGVAIPMATGFGLQAAGLATVAATLSGFVTGLCVCVTPALEWGVFGHRPNRWLVVGIAMATLSVCLMTGGSAEGWRFNLGVVLTALCTLAFSFQIICTGRASRRVGAGPITTASFAAAAALGWAAALALGGPVAVGEALRAVAANPLFWKHAVILVLGATIGAMVLMNVFQERVSSSEAAVIYTAEPVFAMIFAVAILGLPEVPSAVGWIGVALILAANLIVALAPASPAEHAADRVPMEDDEKKP